MQSTSISTARRAVIFGAGVILGLSVMSGSASAAPASDRGASTTSTISEDNDTNDNGTPNNVRDDGDNRHPSGRDKSVESGGSGNQGKTKSDPDDDGRGPDRSNGGRDVPDGPGGADLADQDGNNGCGNDDDFEDDNEGWCGKPKKSEATVVGSPAAADTTTEVEVQPAVAPAAVEVPVQSEVARVMGITIDVKASPVAVAAPVSETVVRPQRTEVLGLGFERSAVAAGGPSGTQVLGVSYERGNLARTGFDLTLLAMAGMALILVGAGGRRISQRV